MHPVLKELYQERNVRALCKFLFRVNLSPKQEEIVRTIGWAEHQRVAINAMTRYGKTYALAMGVLIYISHHPNKTCALIAPTNDQALILRNYLAEMITESPLFQDLIDISSTGLDRLKKESSRKRQTFKNGSEYRVYSAEGSGSRLMGHGINGLLIVDEACLIPEEAWAKISRMLGDNPDETILIEIANPWDRATRYFKDWTSGHFKTIHVGWREAVKEGRTTESFVMEQKRTMTSIEFTVLYESEFPDKADDALFDYSDIKAAMDAEWDITAKEIIIGCDVADKGLDETVIMTAYHDYDRYEVRSIYSEAKSENTAVAGRLVNMQEEKTATIINIDTIGVGTGVVSMTRQGLRSSNCKVNACHFGNKPKDQKRFSNKKAEMYFRLNDLLKARLIRLPKSQKLVEQLMAIKWEFSSTGRIRILDPDKSPDYADALVYTIWTGGAKGYFIA